MTRCELHRGTWQHALVGVTCDALITDPPYGERTHRGQRYGSREMWKRGNGRTGPPRVHADGLPYDHMSADDAAELVEHWAPRTRGWICIFTSHDLAPAYTEALEAAGRYVFAPLPCVQTGMNVRLAGDGPSNWTCWLVVARPRSMARWGTLRGAYVGTPTDPGMPRSDKVPGGKPLWLMRAVVRDYSRPGDVVCDPFAGGATTLLAARAEGRHAVGAEMDAERHALGIRRMTRPYTLDLFGPADPVGDAGAAR